MHHSGLQWIAVHHSGLQCITVDCSAGGLVDWHCSTAGTHPPESLPWITSTKLINFLSRPDLRMIAPLFFFLNLQNWPGFPWAKGYKKNNKLLKQLLLKGPRWQCMRDFYMFLFAPFPKSFFLFYALSCPESNIIFFFVHLHPHFCLFLRDFNCPNSNNNKSLPSLLYSPVS